MTEQQPDNDWVTEPVQARSQETLTRFLTAADALLREQRFDDITVAEIVRRAERTVGSFYARFTDKDALVRTLVQSVIDELAEDIRQRFSPDRWQRATMVAIVSEAIAASITIFWKHAHIARAGLILAARDEDAREFRHANYHSIGDAVALALKSVATHDEPMPADRDIHDAVEVVTAVLDTRVLYADEWKPGSILDLPTEIEHVTNICLKVLRLR